MTADFFEGLQAEQGNRSLQERTKVHNEDDREFSMYLSTSYSSTQNEQISKHEKLTRIPRLLTEEFKTKVNIP